MGFRTTYIIIFIAFITVSLGSCRKSIEKPSWDVEMVAPVVRTTLTLGDILPDSLTTVNPDSSIILSFDNTVYRFSLDTLVDVPDTTINFSYTTPSVQTDIAPGGQIYTLTDDFDYEIDDVELHELKIRSGQIDVVMTSSVPEAITVTYTLTSSGFQNTNGPPLVVVSTVPAAPPGGTSTLVETHDISGYHLDLTGPTQTEFNKLTTNLVIQNAVTSDTLHVTGGMTVSVDNSFVDVIPEYARGYFGSRDIDIDPATEEFDAFNRVIGGSLDIDDIDVELEIRNGVGVDATATIHQLSAINSNSGAAVNLNHSSIGNIISIDRAEDFNGWIDVKTWNAQMNPANSNIDQFFETLPNQMGYDLDILINPLGNVSGSNDFIYYESELVTDLKVNIPLCLIASDLALTDTIDVEIRDTSYAGRVNRGTFTVYSENGFPFDANIQLYILDDNGNALDSLFTDNLILAASVDGNNDVTASATSTQYIDIPASKADLLYESNRMAMVVKFNTVDAANGFTKLYSHYKLDLKLVADFEYTVDLNDE